MPFLRILDHRSNSTPAKEPGSSFLLDKDCVEMAWTKPVVGIAQPPDDCFCDTSVLLRAVEAGAPKRVKFLLEQGCDPNLACGTRRIYPLMMACYISNSKKQLSIVNSLLLYGADPSLRDLSSRNSLMYACTLAHEDVVETIVYGADYDLNAVDTTGNTALHYAAVVGKVNIVNVLVGELRRFRLDLNKRNELFLTPLTTALLSKSIECAKALFSAGAAPSFTVSEFHQILAQISEGKSIYSLVYSDLSDSAVVHDAFCSSGSSRKSKLTSQQFLRSMKKEIEIDALPAKCKRRAGIGRTDSCSLPSIHYPSTVYSSGRSSGRVSTRDVLSPSNEDMKQPTTCLMIYHSLMTKYYPIMSSPLRCPRPRNVAEINLEWIETVNRAFLPAKLLELKGPVTIAGSPSPTDVAQTNRKLSRIDSGGSLATSVSMGARPGVPGSVE